MPLVDLLRHGETAHSGLLMGRTDCALSAAGERQFERQTAGLAWARIVTSPLARSRGPAERLGAERALPVEIDPDWQEIDLGLWEGMALADLRADPEAAKLVDRFYRDPTSAAPPGGEAWSALAARVGRALDRLAEGAETALVVSHAGPIRTALSLATGIPMGALWAIRIDPATRVRLRLGRDGEAGLWGEIVEIAQP